MHFLLVVDKASRFPFAYPSPSKQAEGAARHLMQLCLRFKVTHAIRCGGGGDFEARYIQHLCTWLRADIQYGPADHEGSGFGRKAERVYSARPFGGFVCLGPNDGMNTLPLHVGSNARCMIPACLASCVPSKSCSAPSHALP